MKKKYFLVLSLCFLTIAKAQIINFPNAQFKADLLYWGYAKKMDGTPLIVDTNGDKEIDVSEALMVYGIVDENQYITDMTGIEYFTNLRSLKIKFGKVKKLDLTNLKNLEYLDCSSNSLLSLKISGLSNLTYLDCSSNGITDLDFTGLSNLKTLSCAQNATRDLTISNLPLLETANCLGFSGDSYTTTNITTLTLQNLPSLKEVDCSHSGLSDLKMSGIDKLEILNCKGNKLTTLDASEMYSAVAINVVNNYPLSSLFVKNGRNENLIFGNNTNKSELKFICMDEFQIESIQSIIDYSYPELRDICVLSSYCTFKKGGISYNINGGQKWDLNNNGCDNEDLIYPFMKFNITDGVISQDLITNESGNYNFYPQQGNHIITPIFIENPTYFNVSPTTLNVTFPTQASPFTQDFCITANGIHPDLEIALLPLQPARPGFDAKYKIVYKNKGNQTQSGSVNLSFDDAVLDLVVANPVITSQTENNLSWNFTDLKPFETREITFTLNVNSPMETPAVNIDNVLKFNATIISQDTDETPLDNTFNLNQTVVGSLDPNDKTCLEGTTISPNLIGQYVHYMIRFENTGTYPAQNIVVKDMIDLNKFDISTLVPTSSSHSFITNITKGNKVEFIFENINLPFDDANNDGYIAFKIKTLPTLKVGDSFTNDASIYFDYNFPIVTKLASSTFKTLGTQDFEFSTYFTLYPNPAKSVLNISSKETIEVQSISIYNTLGQLVLVVPNGEKVSKIDVSSLISGNYFIKINSDKGTSNTRFIKE